MEILQNESKEKINEELFFRIGLYTICDSLHGSWTGASDPLDKETARELTAYLQKRLDNWSPSPHYSADYDRAMKTLIAATIREQGGLAPRHGIDLEDGKKHSGQE